MMTKAQKDLKEHIENLEDENVIEKIKIFIWKILEQNNINEQ